MSLDPTTEELATFNNVNDIAEWVGLEGSPDNRRTPRGSLFLLLGIGGMEHPRIVAFIGRMEFNDLLQKWAWAPAPAQGEAEEVSVSPTPAQVSQGGLLGRACRIKAGNQETIREADARQQAPSPAPNAAPIARGARTIKLSLVVNQNDDTEVEVLSQGRNSVAFNAYRARTGAFPPDDEELSAEQLTGLHALLSTGRVPYVDHAIWGPQYHRIQKKLKLKGVRLDASGAIVPIEINGPEHFEQWMESYAVFKTGAIMFEAISPAMLDAYSKHIRHYHERYGRGCWAIIYQADVRARLELTERLRRQGASARERAPAQGFHHEFDPANPWEWVWKNLPGDRDFWHRELEEPALLVLAKTMPAGAALDHDAPVGRPATTGDRQPPAKKQRRNGKDKSERTKAYRIDDKTGLWSHNRAEVELCRNFQKGDCMETVGNGICGKNPNARHQCGKCLELGHSALTCKKPMPGKGGGKGGKGSRK